MWRGDEVRKELLHLPVEICINDQFGAVLQGDGEDEQVEPKGGVKCVISLEWLHSHETQDQPGEFQ